MNKIEKAKYYAGVMLLLKSENLLSMVLLLQFMEALKRGCGLTDQDLYDVISWAEDNIDLDVSSIYMDWKKLK